jgi:hypothetical protein
MLNFGWNKNIMVLAGTQPPLASPDNSSTKVKVLELLQIVVYTRISESFIK